jgi:hypothetical protein
VDQVWTRHLCSTTAAALLFALTAQALPAQSPDESLPATSNVAGAESPAIHRDGRIMFTLRAPEANSLQIAGVMAWGRDPSRC